MKKHLSKVPILLGPLAHWVDVKFALTSLFRLAILDDSTRFYNLLWCVLTLGGIGNEGFDCIS